MIQIKFQKFIYRENLKNNPNIFYIFGDNDMRVGYGGQAKEMRGEQNAIGVRTKKAPRTGKMFCYTDIELSENISKINKDFDKIRNKLDNGYLVVFPLEGLGTGLAKLKEYAPKTLLYINKLTTELIEKYNKGE